MPECRNVEGTEFDVAARRGTPALAQRSRHASAPPQLDPAPAVQPKQWAPVATRRARKAGRREVADVRPGRWLHAKTDGVVEVAIVHPPVPCDVQLVATHESGHRCRVERRCQCRDIASQRAASFQVARETADRHVRDGQQARERHAPVRRESPPVVGLQRGLGAWQAGSTRVVHEIEREVGLHSIAGRVELPQRLDRCVEGATPALRVDVVLRVARQARDQMHRAPPTTPAGRCTRLRAGSSGWSAP